MGKDVNGIETRAVYLIITEVEGEKLAWTHIVPEGTPVSRLGYMPEEAAIVLRPIINVEGGDKSQLWQLRPSGVWPEPSYQIITKMDRDGEMNSPAMIINIDSDFSGDGDNRYFEEFNRFTVGTNNGTTSTSWKLTKQNDKFIIQNFLGIKERLNNPPVSQSRSFWNEERVTEAYKATDGKIKLRNREPAGSPSQLWELVHSGYI